MYSAFMPLLHKHLLSADVTGSKCGSLQGHEAPLSTSHLQIPTILPSLVKVGPWGVDKESRAGTRVLG